MVRGQGPALQTKKQSDINGMLWIPVGKPPCADAPDAFTTDAHPKNGGNKSAADPLGPLLKRTKDARDTCKTVCPFRDECLTNAMREERNMPVKHRYGIRGGLLPAQRHELEQTLQRKRAAA